MKRIKGLIIAGYFLCTCLLTFAQDNDFGSWISVEASKKLTKKFSVEFEEEVRIFQNLGKVDRFLTSPGVTYNFNKYLKAGLGYAWIYDHNIDDQEWLNRHRFYGYLQGKIDWGRFTFSLREKYQTTYYKEKNQQYKNYLRSKFQVSYDIKNLKAEPYLSAEMHYRLNNPDGNEIENLRYTLGVEYPFSKKFSIEGFFRLNQDINVKNPVNLYILGAAIKFGL
jgi:hypothetical protein